eukprot:CAMPEP_0197681234 /NCGR_PEP_ID=MMETSP1338-20131121/94596_1 /TAXON_ID=43686 ORGANISM="Pelagodinium beii, Strain RCC1491" /NCGR_SAMPLE_ID=MMETSP1338 /ASSEMBLY_ACC=CAM_ASM_000754 /LENGTH=205 /DNA_ID=CAMNT_0043262541 /DNA_START=1 /DNA_END=615 /DNA_ORIENTATION=+
MEMLLNEFVEEQAMLRQEQDRLHQRVEKATARIKQGRQDQGFIGNLLNDMELQLEVSTLLSDIFRSKEERKVATRRRWTSDNMSQSLPKSISEQQQDEDLWGPFSETDVKLSRSCDIALGTLIEPPGLAELALWVREAICGDPVAEAEALPDAMWAAQLAASQALRQPEASPKPRASPGASPTDGMGSLNFFEFPAGSPRNAQSP